MKKFSLVSLQNFWSTSQWVLRLAWSTNARLLSGFIITIVLESLLPAALALAGRGLINSLVTMMRDSHRELQLLWPWLGLTIAIAMTDAIVSSLGDYLQQCLQDELNLRVTLDVFNHAARLDLTFLKTR